MLYLSPSKIARYFFHECERQLYFLSVGKKDRHKLPLPATLFENDDVTKAIMQGGLEWEEKVITDLLMGKVSISNSTSSSLMEKVFTMVESLEELRNPQNTYLYQLTIEVPQGFYDHFGIDRSVYEFPPCRPDLVECVKLSDGRTRFRIIDIKGSDAMKSYHKVQVTLYALILHFFLKEHNIPGEVDFISGGVWVNGANEPQYFPLYRILLLLEQFLRDGLKQIKEKELGDLSWHLDYRCEWCHFYDYCLPKAREQSHISLLPYLSGYAAKFIRQSGLPTTLHEMANYLQDENNRAKVAQCASLKKRMLRMSVQLQAMTEEKVIPYGGFSAKLPIYEDIRLFLTAQRDQLTGKMFAVAILRIGGEEIFGSARDENWFVAESIDKCDEICRTFVHKLYGIFDTIHTYNSSREWAQQKSIQTYVTDNYEWDNILTILMELLEDTSYAMEAMSLLFYFQCDQLVDMDEHPVDSVPFPVIVLTSAVTRLFAFPSHVAYRLEDLTKHLPPRSGKPFLYNPHHEMTSKISNAMKSDAIFDVWQHGKTEKVEWIVKELKKRLWSANSVLSGIRAQGREMLFAWAPKFKFPERYDFTRPVLSKLAFMVNYESLLQFLAIREQRMLPFRERVELGVSTHVIYRGEDLFQLKDNRFIDQWESGGYWIMADAGVDGEKAQASFFDIWYRSKRYGPSKAALSYVNVKETLETGDEFFLRVESSWSGRFFSLIEGKEYVISPRYIDWNSEKVIKTLYTMDQSNHPILEILERPESLCRDCQEFSLEHPETLHLIQDASFTSSQREAFEHFANNSSTVVWGPPGTGKTHFIAMAILTLVKMSKREGRSMKILVSGFTHAAIENCLCKIQEYNRDHSLDVVKLSKTTTEKASDLKIVTEKELGLMLNSDCSFVVGATLYNIQKGYENYGYTQEFDVVILDEASQVRVPESLLALSHVKNTGRILIVGDHYQLPPIIQGKYNQGEQENKLFTSIFEWLFEQNENKLYTYQLKDNFRMNETLCKYSAQTIYGSEYTAFNSEIANQTISILPNQTREEWVETILNPAYPLIICISDGPTQGQENQKEAEWVGIIASELRRSLLKKDATLYEENETGDEEFWRNGLFIISPHRAQIRAIKRQLHIRGLRGEYFVGTVDKMQGQESDVAIISYGVSDPELAAMEGEFIYSRNRLNVSLTRARAKTILFISRSLLSPSLQIISNDECADGVNFMIGLEAFAEQNGHKKEFSLGEYRLTIFAIKI